MIRFHAFFRKYLPPVLMILIGIALLGAGLMGGTGFLDDMKTNDPGMYRALLIGLPIGIPALLFILHTFFAWRKRRR